MSCSLCMYSVLRILQVGSPITGPGQIRSRVLRTWRLPLSFKLPGEVTWER